MKKCICFVACIICLITLFSIPAKAVQNGSTYVNNEIAAATDSNAIIEETIGKADLLDERNLQSDVISLKVPSNIDFQMDQYGLKHEKQVYSQEYKIKNNGNNYISVEFYDIRCIVADDIVSVDDEWSDEEVREAEERVIKLAIQMSNGDVIPMTEQATNYQLYLEPKEEVAFTIEGCMSNNIHNYWETGDVSIEMVYAAVIDADSDN